MWLNEGETVNDTPEPQTPKKRQAMSEAEKLLFPNGNKLIKEESYFTADIIDADIDPVKCVFAGGNCVEIDTSNYTFLTLTKENLKTILKMLNKAEKEFERELAEKYGTDIK